MNTNWYGYDIGLKKEEWVINKAYSLASRFMVHQVSTKEIFSYVHSLDHTMKPCFSGSHLSSYTFTELPLLILYLSLMSNSSLALWM